jgi:hypothetical protein
MIVVFLLDTSPSMASPIPDAPDEAVHNSFTASGNFIGTARIFNKLTILETAKAGVEHYLRVIDYIIIIVHKR